MCSHSLSLSLLLSLFHFPPLFAIDIHFVALFLQLWLPGSQIGIGTTGANSQQGWTDSHTFKDLRDWEKTQVPLILCMIIMIFYILEDLSEVS